MELYKVLLLSIFMYSINSTSFGQDVQEQLWERKIDQSILKLGQNKLDSALSFAQDAVTIFRVQRNKYYLAGLLVESRVLMAMDSLNLAEERLKAVYKRLDNPNIEAEELLNMRTTASHMLGQLYEELDQRNEAIQYYESCVLGWPKYHRKVEAIVELSKLLFLEKRLQEVVTYLNFLEDSHLSLSQQLDRMSLMGMTYHSIGLDKKGNSFLDQGEKLAKKTPDFTDWKINVSNSLGEIYLEKEHYDTSLYYFREAEQAWRDFDSDDEKKILTLRGFCSLFLKQSDIDSLMQYTWIGISTASNVDDKVNTYYFKSILCFIYSQLEDTQEASLIFTSLSDMDSDYSFNALPFNYQKDVIKSWHAYFKSIGDEKKIIEANKILLLLENEQLSNLKRQKNQSDLRNIFNGYRLRYFAKFSEQVTSSSDSSKNSFWDNIGSIGLAIVILIGAVVYAAISEIKNRSKEEYEKLFAKEKELDFKISDLTKKEEALKNREEEVNSTLEEISNQVLHLSKGRSIQHESIIVINVEEGVKDSIEIHTNIENKKFTSEKSENRRNNFVYKELTSLSKLERVLPDSRFIRTHQSFIINKSYIIERPRNKKTIILKGKNSPIFVVPISRTYKKKFENSLKNS